jgi:hypothetical protein
MDIVTAMQVYYGYKVPDPTRPYSSYNWLKVSGDGKGGGDIGYFKLMFLTEFDCMMHSGVMNNPDLLTERFVRSNVFSDMIKSMSNPGSDPTYNGWGDISTYGNYMSRQHSTILKKGEMLIAGQYIYSKDFKYKLHLLQWGHCYVYKLPMPTDLAAAEFKFLEPNGRNYAANNYIGCYLILQSMDNNFVVYQNPEVTIDYSSLKVTIKEYSGSAISATGTENSALLKRNNYQLILAPGGKIIAAGPGPKNTNTGEIKYMSGATTLNYKNTNDVYDLDCKHGWNYVNEANDIVRGGILSIDSPPNEAKWCYNNPLTSLQPIIPTVGSDGKFIYSYDNAENMFIAWQSGAGLDVGYVADYFANFMNVNTSAFMKKIVTSGWYSNTGLQQLAELNYCSRGKRFATDSRCSNTTLKDMPANIKRFIEFDVTNRLCAQQGADEKKFCSMVAPSDPVVQSLIKIDPGFGYLSADPSAFKLDLNYMVTINNVTFSTVQSMCMIMLDKYSTYTEPQLNLLHSYIKDNDASLTKWQTYYGKLFANASSSLVSKVNATADATKSVISNIRSIVENVPLTVVIFKTGAGIYMARGDLTFPYSATAVNLKYNDSVARSFLTSLKPLMGTKFYNWNGTNYVSITDSDITATIGSNDELKSVFMNPSTPYDLTKMIITNADNSTATCYVYSLTIDPVRLMNAYRATGKSYNLVTDTKYDPICNAYADACYPEVLNYVKTKPFDTNSNKWCDVATNVNKSTSASYFSAANADIMLNECNSAYALKSCSDPLQRYKSGFTSKVIRSGSRPSPVFEMYSDKERFSGGISCNTACSDPNISTVMRTSCANGTIAYCSTGDNIISTLCQSDINKYTGMNDILTSWCSKNANHPSFPTYCPQPSAPVTTTVAPISSAPVVSTSTSPTINPLMDTPTLNGSITTSTPAPISGTTSVTPIPVPPSVTTVAPVDPVQPVAPYRAPVDTSVPELVFKDKPSSGMATWVWILIIIGSILLTAVLGFTIFKLLKKKKKPSKRPASKKKEVESDDEEESVEPSGTTKIAKTERSVDPLSDEDEEPSDGKRSVDPLGDEDEEPTKDSDDDF